MIKTEIGVEDPELFMKVGAALFAYLFRRISHKRFQTILKNHLPAESCEKVLNEARTNGYLLKNCKAFAWSFFKSRYGKAEVPTPRKYKIDEEDAAFLSRLNLSHLNLDFPSYTLAEYQGILDGATSDKAVSLKISKFVSKRMLFLLKSYGVEREDLENECRLGALRSIYMRYPAFDDLQHVRNTANTGIHNAGEDLVKYYTSPTRQRLQKTKDGDFEARNVDLASLAELETPYVSTLASIQEEVAHLDELVKTLNPIEQSYMRVLKGEYDAGFSAHLGEDNRDALESMAASRYLLEARRHFGISNKAGKELFDWLRGKLLDG
jgi:hypothetical protein